MTARIIDWLGKLNSKGEIMINDIYYNPTKIIFGKGTENQVGAETAKYSGKVLLHYGGGSIKKSGLYDTVVKSLKDAGVDFEELGGVKSNPRSDLVYQGIDICRKNGIDFILAVGGGSVIDSAKAIAYGVLYEGDFYDFYLGKATPKGALKVGTILTIPGAGSESSSGTVITDEKLGLKRAVDLYYARPVFSILNPELTYTVPMYHTLAGAFDAIAHVCERYFTNTPAVDVTDRIGEGIMKSLIDNMKKVKDNPMNYDIRSEIMWGCKMAQDGTVGVGRAQDWTSHAIQEDVGSVLMDSSHGAGLAVLMPVWMEYVYKTNIPRFAQFANRVMEVEIDPFDLEKTAQEGIRRLKEFVKNIGLPVTMRELGVQNKDQLKVICDKCFSKTHGTVGGFRPLKYDDVLTIYESAY